MPVTISNTLDHAVLPDDDPVGPQTTNVCAAIALFSALVGLLLPAIVLGIIGFVETGRRPDERGDGLALVAIGLGLLELAGLLLVVWRFQPFGIELGNL